MVKISEHINKINLIKEHIRNARGQQKRQYIKCLHRLQKELTICKRYLKEGEQDSKRTKLKTTASISLRKKTPRKGK